jgi:very-short-patch-repair endonuclease
MVELDGRSYHDRSAAFESDKSRDRAALVVGLHTVRLTWRQIRDEPDGIRADLEQLLGAAPTA